MRAKVKGSPEEILALCEAERPGLALQLDMAQAAVPWCKRQILLHEAAWLFCLAASASQGRQRFFALEIGTARGYSAAVLALAVGAPLSMLTLNPKPGEYEQAVANLARFPSVRVLRASSWEFLTGYRGPSINLCFVDGDHERCELDLPWFNRLVPGGLLVFHDYSPAGSKRACPHVYETVNAFAASLGRGPDFLLEDDRRRGLAAFRRREGESWHGQKEGKP